MTNPKPCKTCGSAFQPRHRKQKFCSVRCGGRSTRGTGPKARPLTKTCAFCQAPFTTTTPAAVTCSKRCAGRHRAGWSIGTDLVHVPQPNACDLPARHPARRPPPPKDWWNVIVSGPCRKCGQTFTAFGCIGVLPAYCSKRCLDRESRFRRNAAKRGAYVEDVHRARIFERDGWRCQICRRKVDRTKSEPHPKAPTLDHIIPLANGGTHEPANAQLACFRCNTLKSNTGVGDQLRLIG